MEQERKEPEKENVTERLRRRKKRSLLGEERTLVV